MVVLGASLAWLALFASLCAAPAAVLPGAPSWSQDACTGDPAGLDAALARAFPTADAIAVRIVNLSDAQRAALVPSLCARVAPKLWSCREARRQGQLLGRAVVEDVIGKSLPITYLLILAPDNRVRAIEILDYREAHGGEVRREKWRAQFAGLGASDEVKLGSDIRNIAGATLSCRALTDAVHDVLAIAAVAFAPVAAPTIQPAAAPAARFNGEERPGVFRRTQLLMGTLLDLRCVSGDRAAFDAAADAAFKRVAELEALWSTWIPASEVSRLNAAEPGAWCALSPETLALLSRARQLRSASDDAFAIESGPLIELWHQAQQAQCVPTATQVAQAREASARGSVECDVGQSRARKKTLSARLDLGAIGKGAALDEVAREFRARGLSRALFDFGGQLLALQGPVPGAGWPVALRDPRPVAIRPLWEMDLESASLSSSADDQRGLLIAGRRFSHIVDPRSGMPAQSLWTACSLAANATDADAWSTAVFVLGHERASELASRAGVRVLTLDMAGEIRATKDFPGHAGQP